MHSSSPGLGRLRAAVATLAVAALVFAAAGAGAQAVTTDDAFPVQLVTVDTPTRDHKDVLNDLGLDLTEHAGHDYVEVVLHSAADEEALRDSGLTWDVRIPDLMLLEARNNQVNREFSAATVTSPLPSGRDSYRRLEDYNTDLEALVDGNPGLVRPITLSRTSLEGKPIHGIEIAADVDTTEDGRPTFAMFGLHHAREWPSGEHSIEFAFDLVNGYGSDQRITDLLQRTRVIVVPVVNVDGFEKSVNDGLLVDLRELDGGGTASILGTPNNAYKRKNCRVVDGQEPLPGSCDAAKSPGSFGVGVDLNRNYGAFWGGPGASDVFADPTYRGAAHFSEPETQAVRELVASRHVTTLITNHTFSNLVLRPNGVAPDTIGPDGYPVGDAPDEQAMKDLGARMAAQNGYTNQHGWELYDTTGTTEDWSYNVTGGFGYTFEIGPDEFHPPYPEVIDEYLGAGEYAGKGNREAFLIALENAADATTHSVVAGKAPAGATLRLKRTSPTTSWDGSFQDTVDTTMTVADSRGRYTWHINPSTRPLVQARQYRVLSGEPIESAEYSGTTPPLTHTDQEFTVTHAGADALEVKLDWPTPDDMDLYVYRANADGSLTEVGSSTSFVLSKERVLVQAPDPGTYVLRVENFASATPTWTLTAGVYDMVDGTVPALIEAWTMSCEVNGDVREQKALIVDRGQRVKADFSKCRGR
ncbi:MAG: carboxypeptidase [Nitriliruptorales bacterium]|nr:carboxypeptidase [Nitriliruptorales bacterium]